MWEDFVLLSAPAWPLSPHSPAPSPTLLSTTSNSGEEQAPAKGVRTALYVHGAHLHPSPLFCSEVYLAHNFLFSSLLGKFK